MMASSLPWPDDGFQLTKICSSQLLIINKILAINFWQLAVKRQRLAVHHQRGRNRRLRRGIQTRIGAEEGGVGGGFGPGGVGGLALLLDNCSLKGFGTGKFFGQDCWWAVDGCC